MSDPPHANPRSDATRNRLLRAGAELFATRGFRSTTIRAICTRARANLAAVNYHFRDKDGLYRAVLKDSLSRAFEKYPPTWCLGPDPTPDDRLRAWIRAFFYRLLDDAPDAFHGPLLAREMASPTPALAGLVEGVLRPVIEILHGILRDLLGPGIPPVARDAVVASVAGQVLFYRHCRPVIERLNPEIRYSREDLERWSDHVARFCLAGIAALRAQGDR